MARGAGLAVVRSSSLASSGLLVVTTGRALVPVTRVLVPSPPLVPEGLFCLGSGAGTCFFGTTISLLSSSPSSPSSSAGAGFLVVGCGLQDKPKLDLGIVRFKKILNIRV